LEKRKSKVENRRWKIGKTSSVLHGMGDSGDSEIALGDVCGATGQDRAKSFDGMAREESLERLAALALGMEEIEEASDGVGDFVGGAPIADGTGDGGDLADTASHTEIVGIDHFAVGFDFFAFDADVGDPVLAAGVGAAGDVETEFVLIVWKTFFELLGEPASVGLGFGEGEFAEFGAGAGDRAANESGRFYGKTGGGEFVDYDGNVSFGNVDEKQVLNGGIANVAITIAFGEVGGESELSGRDSSANDGSADGKEAGLLLRDDAEMIAVDMSGGSFWFGGIEREIETRLERGEEGVGGPAVLKKRNFRRALSREWRRTSLSRKISVMARTTGTTWFQWMKALRGTARWGWVESPPPMRREKPISWVVACDS